MSDRLLSCPSCRFTTTVEDALLEHVALDHRDVRPLSAHLGGLYEQTGLYEGPVTSWGARHEIILAPIDAPGQVQALWARICAGLAPLEGYFGPGPGEAAAPRPRPQDRYLAVGVDHHGRGGHPCGDVPLVGLAWIQAPSATTRAYGFGLFPECRGLGHGVDVKRALIARCFEEGYDPAAGLQGIVHRVEAEVIGFNLWPLKTLHGIDDEMTEEGRLREAVLINGIFYDRIFFGLLRPTWAARCAARTRVGVGAHPDPTIKEE